MWQPSGVWACRIWPDPAGGMWRHCLHDRLFPLHFEPLGRFDRAGSATNGHCAQLGGWAGGGWGDGGEGAKGRTMPPPPPPPPIGLPCICNAGGFFTVCVPALPFPTVGVFLIGRVTPGDRRPAGCFPSGLNVVVIVVAVVVDGGCKAGLPCLSCRHGADGGAFYGVQPTITWSF